jgi:beta-lactamase regulating signal transducer with metallopeptidase domain
MSTFTPETTANTSSVPQTTASVPSVPQTTASTPTEFPVWAIVLCTIGGIIFVILAVVAIYLLLTKYRRTSTGKFRLYDDIIDIRSSPAAEDPSDLSDSRQTEIKSFISVQSAKDA